MSRSTQTFGMADFEGVVPRDLNLVAALTGFTDAGNTVAQLVDHLLDNLDYEEIAVFDNDSLFDYRARRPMLTFDGDHLHSYEPAVLKLYLMQDELEKPFLLLAGYEPDFRWDAFVEDLLGLIDDLGVSNVTWVQALPMPVPHTRKIGSTLSGNRADLIQEYSVWKPKTRLPANVLQVLEYRLYNEGKSVCGFSMLVPHYLADNNYPTALISALDRISSAAGLLFPYEPIREREAEFFEKLQNQYEINNELQRMVENLEKRHDQYMEKFRDNRDSFNMMNMEEDLPSAEDLAAEFERFLAAREQDDDPDSSI